MANIKLDGTPTNTRGEIPQKGDGLKDFRLVNTKMETKSIKDYAGKRKVMNIFPSVETGVCAKAVRRFNEEASALDNTVVLNISKDLPFAQKRFCAAEGIENVEMLSDYRFNQFGEDYQTQITDGAFEGLMSRAVIVADENDQVLYSEQVPDIAQEPDYQAALKGGPARKGVKFKNLQI